MRPTFLAAALLGMALALPAAAQDTQRQISVTGSAEVEAVPDLATVTAGVETQAKTAAEALAMNSTAMTAVFAALDAAKIERRDFQTSQLNLNPVFETAPDANPGGMPQVTGYQASNMVTVKVRDVARLGPVIDAVTTSGANRLYGVGFEVSDPQAALDSAREKAIADARTKAELFAKVAGVKLGSVLSLSEGGGMGGPVPMFAKADMAAAPPVAAGTVTLSATVQLVVAIE